MLLANLKRLSMLFFAPTSKLSTLSELNVSGAALMLKVWKSPLHAAYGTGLLPPPGRKPLAYVK